MYFSLLSSHRGILILFPLCLSIRLFLLCSLSCHILIQNCFASLASSCWYVFMSSPSLFLVDFLFFSSCFGMSCVDCIVFPNSLWVLYKRVSWWYSFGIRLKANFFRCPQLFQIFKSNSENLESLWFLTFLALFLML